MKDWLMLLRIYSLTRSTDIHTDNNAVSDKTGKHRCCGFTKSI